MTTIRHPLLRAVTACVLTLSIGACFIVRQVNVRNVPRAPQHIRNPVKVHLVDGMTVLYRQGVEIRADSLVGYGVQYDLTLRDSTPIRSMPLSRVLGMEAFAEGTNAGATIAFSILGTAVVALGAIAIACAADPKCFGSCPTIYSDSAGRHALEAEGFSYSIAPLFEMRDVDRLRLARAADTTVTLEIRNEALETHYINHLEVIEARHAAGELVVPDARGIPLALAAIRRPASAHDRAGRSMLATLADADGDAYRTERRVLAKASAADLHDWIDLTVPAPAADSAAVLLRLRNSLLTTVLFYDLMLGDRGAGAIDYQVDELQQIGTAVDLGRWYVDNMGMRVSVWQDGAWREAGRFLDTGPVAWKDLAVMVPVPRGAGELRVRLSFVADNWRIDRVAIAAQASRPASRTLPLSRVIDSDGRADTTALASMVSADTRYLQTQASQRFTARFDAGAPPVEGTRSFLIATQGWYTEWIRQGWIATGGQRPPMQPNRDAIAEAISRWRSMQRDYERQFAATRVPVR